MKILSNLPIEDLNKENDYLGIIEKGDMIVSLLTSDAVDLSEIKMFALYGDWGSGKSTLMKYMKKQFDASDSKFKTFYFDAWQYENGRDLSYSLLEFMIDEGLEKTEKVATELLEVGRSVLMGFAKSASFSIPGIRFTPKELIEELQKDSRKSFHSEIQDFKKEFRELENKILSTDSEKYNIVFIDDLDRCEPDKVLDLLSEIKLFFNYGERTVFFFGVDEKAVQLAIKQKYGESLKSSEYLEKIFDAKFRIGNFLYRQEFIPYYFQKVLKVDNPLFLDKYVIFFLSCLGLNNMRKLKKVFNQYSFLIKIHTNQPYSIIPNIIGTKNGSILFSIITLYLIVLRLFYESELESFNSPITKRHSYVRAYQNSADREKNNAPGYALTSDIFDFNDFSSSIVLTFKECREKDDWTNFLIFFSPLNPTFAKINSLENKENFLETFESKSKQISYKFTLYLLEWFLPYYEIEPADDERVSFKNFKNLVDTLI